MKLINEPGLIEIKKLAKRSALELVKIYNQEDPGYVQYFNPFVMSRKILLEKLSKIKKDHFFGVYHNRRIVGFYMLRGFDEGYTIPTYGVYINSVYSGFGLASLTLQHAFNICNSMNIQKLMLKVHPENKTAYNFYISKGFCPTGSIDPKNDNHILIKDFQTANH